MRLRIRWRWVLPFIQLVIAALWVHWWGEQVANTVHKAPSPPTVSSEGEVAAVGWDPRSCWDCDSVPPIVRYLFLAVLGVFFWAGVKLDRRRAVDEKARSTLSATLFALAAIASIGAAFFLSFGWPCGMPCVIVLCLLMTFGLMAARRSTRAPTNLKPVSATVVVGTLAACVVMECVAVGAVFRIGH